MMMKIHFNRSKGEIEFYVRNNSFKRLLWMKGYNLITDQNIIGIQESCPINADFIEYIKEMEGG